MPEMNGIETIKYLNNIIESLPPIIALTANSDPGIKEYYLNEGFCDYLEKPIDKSSFEKIIKQYLNK